MSEPVGPGFWELLGATNPLLDETPAVAPNGILKNLREDTQTFVVDHKLCGRQTRPELGPVRPLQGSPKPLEGSWGPNQSLRFGSGPGRGSVCYTSVWESTV